MKMASSMRLSDFIFKCFSQCQWIRCAHILITIYKDKTFLNYFRSLSAVPNLEAMCVVKRASFY